MARKQINASKKRLFITLLLCGIALLLLPQDVTKGLNFLFVRVFNPLLNIGRRAPQVFLNHLYFLFF